MSVIESRPKYIIICGLEIAFRTCTQLGYVRITTRALIALIRGGNGFVNDTAMTRICWIVKFNTKRSSPKRTIIENNRRYGQDRCPHKGPYIVYEEKWTIECDDCGALLNPIWCFTKLAKKEAYYNQRIIDLSKHLTEIKEELKSRERTKCTHCGNMTAIRLKHDRPLTWEPS